MTAISSTRCSRCGGWTRHPKGRFELKHTVCKDREGCDARRARAREDATLKLEWQRRGYGNECMD